MTISGHDMAMKEVRIAELKARLSEYLRAVRRGETISVLDRDTPVAQIVPIRERSALRIRKPTPGTPAPNRVPLPKLTKQHIDVVHLLLEERQGARGLRMWMPPCSCAWHCGSRTRYPNGKRSNKASPERLS